MLKTMSRRSFIKASAATAATVSMMSLDTRSWMQVKAAEETADIRTIPSICNACSSQCGMIAYTKNGRLWKLEGHPDHPRSQGTLCARGHAYPTVAYSPDRITSPMKRKADGGFEPISWEQAYEEIGEKVRRIIRDHGAEQISLMQNPVPTGVLFATRFIHALGSPNYFTHHVACNNSRDTGFNHTVGGVPSADVAHADYVMFIGRSYGDAIRPASLKALAAAKERNAKVVMVDPRYNQTAPFADTWLPIRPGTDLALLLAIAHVLIRDEGYDKAFVEKHAVGFDAFCEGMTSYTPAWAAGVTGLTEAQIEAAAADLAANRPKALIEQSWRGAFGCNYENSSETARMVALVNAMLGNLQQEGGMIFGAGAGLGALDETRYPEPVVEGVKEGAKEFPLAPGGRGVANIVPLRAKEGTMKALFVNRANPALGFGNPAYYKEALAMMDLVVTIDVQMSETAMLSDYVLPEVSYMERDDAVQGIGGKQATVAMRCKVIDPVHPDTKPGDRIFTELAEACGVGAYFDFTLEDHNAAALEPLGLTVDELREKGAVRLDRHAELGTLQELDTPSGKVEFYSDTVKDAGFSPVPQWMPPLVMPKKDTYRLTTGKQAIHSHTQTANNGLLMQITKDYQLERLWMNRSAAENKGIAEGDLVEVVSELATSKVRVMLTERLHPETVYIPSHYGIRSPYQTTAKGIGFSFMDHVPFHFQSMSGCNMIHEVIVNVRKAGE